jgi:ATP synthase subunit c
MEAVKETVHAMSYLNYAAISLAVLGVAYGISKIGSHAMDAIARQPEAADKVQAAMLIACGLIEGAGLIGLIFSAPFMK